MQFYNENIIMKTILLSLSVLFLVVQNSITQEVPNAPVNAKVQINNARTDGEQDLNPPTTFVKSIEVTKLENKINEIRKSSNPDLNEITNLQKQLINLTGFGSFSNAGYYSGNVTPSTLLEQFDMVGNTLVLSKSGMKGIVTVTEATGGSKGRIWLVAGFSGSGSMSSPDSLRVLYSTNNGLSWIAYANVTLAGTDKINNGEIDAELIEGGSEKYLHIVYGLRASGGTGKWFSAGASIKLTGSFAGNTWALTWPGDDATKRYYSPRITSDNFEWVTSPWVYIAVSFDSAGTTGRINTQKQAQWNSPNSVTPTFLYKGGKVFWYNETFTQQNLYTDIAFFKNSTDSLIISFCGTPDSTAVFFSKVSASASFVSPSSPGQYIGPVGGSQPDAMKISGRLSSNGNDNGSIFFIFYQSVSANNFGVKYFRTTNFGNFNAMNQSVLWTAPFGTSKPDITGIRGANTHRFAFFFWGNSTDSLKYVSVNSSGSFTSNSTKMNTVNLTTGNYGPAVGTRFVSGDSCFALYSALGPADVYSAFGCSGTLTNIGNVNTPLSFELKQNYPNPFNPVTNIGYSLLEGSVIRISVYDVTGREISVLVNEFKQAGDYSVVFDASELNSGVYFYKISSGNFTDAKKMILLK